MTSRVDISTPTQLTFALNDSNEVHTRPVDCYQVVVRSGDDWGNVGRTGSLRGRGREIGTQRTSPFTTIADLHGVCHSEFAYLLLRLEKVVTY